MVYHLTSRGSRFNSFSGGEPGKERWTGEGDQQYNSHGKNILWSKK